MSPKLQTEKPETIANADIAELLSHAEKEDATVLPQLRRLLDDSSELWHGYGDLASQARASWMQLTARSNLLMAESLLRKAADLLKEVAGASPSPLEQLLAERVVVCWLQVSYYDSVVAQTREYTPAKAHILQQQHDAAHRRYLTAMKTLATVRKLVMPPRSPVEIASKLVGERSGLRLREAPVTAGVPVEN